jgi:hypothetical protein
MVGVEFNGKGGSLSKRFRISKQVIEIWHSVLTPEHSATRRVVTLFFVCGLHGLPLLVPKAWLQTSKESAPKSESVRIKIAPNQKTSASVAAESAPKNRKDSQSADPTKIKQKSPQQKNQAPRVMTSVETAQAPQETNSKIPIAESAPSRTQASSNAISKSALMEERKSPLLPSGHEDFIARQRHLGKTLGAGAVAGDIEIPDVISEKNPNDPITRKEYTFAGYFDNLSRRFAEAWGGVRTLPPQSRFDGKLGEFIEYDVVINRDGSLRKIVNVSARREPYRDFAAVDELVASVFKTMFPFQPVPERIHNDPLVIRKRIQFVGFKYSLY